MLNLGVFFVRKTEKNVVDLTCSKIYGRRSSSLRYVTYFFTRIEASIRDSADVFVSMHAD